MSTSPPGTHDVRLPRPVPPELERELLAKLYWASPGLSGIELADADRQTIRFRLPLGPADPQPVARTMARVAEQLISTHRGGAGKVLVPRRAQPPRFLADPHPLLEEAGELRAYGRGRYGLGPRLCGLVAAFDAMVERLADEWSASPRQFPSLIGADTLARCRYLRSFPQSLTLVTHLREDLDLLDRFSQQANVEGGELVGHEPSDLSGVEALLASAVCFHWYAWLADSQLPGSSAVTCRGKCFRYESGTMQGIERLWDFTMREVVFVGTAEYVTSCRQTAIDRSVELLAGLGLDFEVVGANDPFFVAGYSAQAAFQSAFGLKYEARALLPWKSDTLAVGSFNYHQDMFGRMFGIRLPDGSPAHTSCVGFGLERLALAVTAQMGVDPSGWPAALRGTGVTSA